MKIIVTIAALLLAGSMAGCLKVDSKDASKEWAEVGKSWAEAFKEQGQEQGHEQEKSESR